MSTVQAVRGDGSVLWVRYYEPARGSGLPRLRVFRDGLRGVDPLRVSVGWDNGASVDENYRRAVDEYVRRAGWVGSWLVSLCDVGAVAVQVAGDSIYGNRVTWRKCVTCGDQYLGGDSAGECEVCEAESTDK